MTTQDVLTACEDLPLMELYKLQSGVRKVLEKKKKILRDSVKVRKEKRSIYLEHQDNGTYCCKQEAFRGRWRMWKMVPGVRGLKRGPIVVHEHMDYGHEGLESLKIQIALGYYKFSE